MGKPLKLDCFDLGRGTVSSMELLSEEALEDERLQAFDNGYRAGWDDSASAFQDDQRRISGELANNLQDLSFTYHEARNAMVGEMEEILRVMVEQILPSTLTNSLGEMIVRKVTDVASDVSEVPVEIVVSPGSTKLIQDLVAGKVAPPLRILEEQSLGEGQAYLRMGTAEHKFDLESVLREISDAVSNFFERPMVEDLAHA
jgi:flagellar assembly protein FliH